MWESYSILKTHRNNKIDIFDFNLPLILKDEPNKHLYRKIKPMNFCAKILRKSIVTSVLIVFTIPLFAQFDFPVELEPEQISWEEARLDIFPVIETAEETPKDYSKTSSYRITMDYNKELQVSYKINTRNMYVFTRDIDIWGISADSLHKVAIANLINSCKGNLEFNTNYSRTLSEIILYKSDFDASLLLVPELWLPVAKEVLQTENVLIAIPKQGALYVLVPNSKEAQQELKKDVANLCYHDAPVISDRLFKYKKKKWIAY